MSGFLSSGLPNRSGEPGGFGFFKYWFAQRVRVRFLSTGLPNGGVRHDSGRNSSFLHGFALLLLLLLVIAVRESQTANGLMAAGLQRASLQAFLAQKNLVDPASSHMLVSRAGFSDKKKRNLVDPASSHMLVLWAELFQKQGEPGSFSPNPLVSRGPQTLTQKGLEQGPNSLQPVQPLFCAKKGSNF